MKSYFGYYPLSERQKFCQAPNRYAQSDKLKMRTARPSYLCRDFRRILQPVGVVK